MSVNPKGMEKVNAQGVGAQDLRSEKGGNNSRGVFGQSRPTGIMAEGRKGKKRDAGLRGMGR